MKTAKQPTNEFKEIKDIILNKICKEARVNGHDDVAETIEKYAHKLKEKNTHWEWGKDVTEFSSAVKERAIDVLFIQTKFPDWFKVDRKILESKLLNDETSIYTSFSRVRYPVDENLLEMKRLGIETIIVPGLPSINITKGEITFYYVDDPLSTQPESRVAITVDGRIGKKLSDILSKIYWLKFTTSEYQELLPSIKNKMREAMEKIQQNKDEIDVLHELVYDKSLDNWERIGLSIFFFQLENKDYIPIQKIEKDTDIEYSQIRKEIGRFYDRGELFEYRPAVGNFAGAVRLSGEGMSSSVPRLLFDILQDKEWHNILKLQRIQSRYGLTVKSILEKNEARTKVTWM